MCSENASTSSSCSGKPWKIRTCAAIAATRKKEQKEPFIEIFEPDNLVREEVEEIEGVMGDESGGLSANKGVAQEDEGNTTPFPERVCVLWVCSIFHGMQML